MGNTWCKWCGSPVTSWNHQQHNDNCPNRPVCEVEGCDETTTAKRCYDHWEENDG